MPRPGRKIQAGGCYTGDAVQPGGFMSAARWQLAADHIDSVSGEFRVVGEDDANTQALSQAFVAELKQRLGAEFAEALAEDHIRGEFVCTACKKKRGLRGLLGAIAAVAISFYAPGAFSALIGEGAAAGSTWAAATATSAAGTANAVTSAALAGMASSATGQLIATGRLDGNSLLYAGLTGAVGGYTSNLASTGELSPLAKWSIDTATAGAAAPLVGSSFEKVLLGSVLDRAAAVGANVIGSEAFGPQGSVGHTLAHGALAATLAMARGADPAGAAIGAMSEALFTPTASQILGPEIDPRLLDLTMRLIGGLTAEAAGRDGIAASNAAGNALENNWLHPKERDLRERALRACAGGADNGCRIAQLLYQLDAAREDTPSAKFERGFADALVRAGGAALLMPAELTQAALEGRIAELLANAVQGLVGLPGRLAAGLQSDDPEVRGGALAETLLTVSGAAGYARGFVARLNPAAAQVRHLAGTADAETGVPSKHAGDSYSPRQPESPEGTGTSDTNQASIRARVEASLGESLAARRASNFEIHSIIERMPSLDVSTPVDRAIVWSNARGGNLAVADAYISQNPGYLRLEMTPGGRYLESLDLFQRYPYGVAIQPWEKLSAQYARGTSGEVLAFTSGASPNSVFKRIELPILLQNPNVTRLRTMPPSNQ